MPGDNFKVEVQSDSRKHFDAAIEILFAGAAGGYATHYRADATQLILFWREERGATPLPYKLDANLAKTFCWDWLSGATRGPQPDHDGDNHPGFAVLNDSWGRVDGTKAGFLKIIACWQTYGK